MTTTLQNWETELETKFNGLFSSVKDRFNIYERENLKQFIRDLLAAKDEEEKENLKRLDDLELRLNAVNQQIDNIKFPLN